MKTRNCPSCGAPITTEICPYCHVATNIKTQDCDMEYPVIDCKEANIGFWNVVFPMIFAVAFGFFGLIFPLFISLMGESDILPYVLFCSIFAIIGITAFIIAMLPILRFLLIKFNGKEIEATVYGYMNDNLYLNGEPAQIVKLLVNTKDGPKFILYQLADIKHPYKINSKIKLLAFNDKFLIKKEKETYF